MAFVVQLFSGLWVEQAYREVVGERDARQAWRWLNLLHSKLGEFRSLLKTPLANSLPEFHQRSTRLQLLLPTLKQLVTQASDFSQLQLKRQQAII